MEMKRWAVLVFLILTVVFIFGLGAIPAYAGQNDSIIIDEPDAGENLLANSTYEIKWDVPSFMFIALAYTTDDGVTWNDITSGNSTDFGTEDSYSWTIPDINASKVKIRITITNVIGFPPSVTTDYNDSGEFSITRFTILPLNLIPEAPSDLEAESVSSEEIELSWKDNSGNETGFRLERKIGSGSFSQLEILDPDEEEFTDDSVQPGKTYSYRIRAFNLFGNSQWSNTLAATTPEEEDEDEDEDEDNGSDSTTVNLLFTVGSKYYELNGDIKTMDAAPVVRNSRTLLPILYVADPLGAQVTWNSIEKKVTIKVPGKTIELWISKNIAKINGTSVMIDSSNSSVTPLIISGRTMLPLRFIADNLNCNVIWNAANDSIEVNYPK